MINQENRLIENIGVKQNSIYSVVHHLADLDYEEDDRNSEFFRENLLHLNEKSVGTGSFGTVIQCVLKETNEVVAIKRVLQDKKYKV
jgi:glycogen synthase kinase 3 beta